jgi:hypothetical protein
MSKHFAPGALPAGSTPELSDVLINVDNVSKRFCRSLKRSLWTGLQALLLITGIRQFRRMEKRFADVI